jgi:hypothetical protein
MPRDTIEQFTIGCIWVACPGLRCLGMHAHADCGVGMPPGVARGYTQS